MAIRSFLNPRKNLARVLIVLALVAVVVFALLSHKSKTNLQENTPAPSKPVSTNSTSDNSSSTATSGAGQASKPSDTKSVSATGQSSPTFSGTLTAPSGQFVSNHHPNLSGSPAPSDEQSTCNTSPGASCTISFSKDGATKSLAAKVADGQGVAIWNWKLQDIGLTQGNWIITATASGGGQSKTATDAQPLSIGP